MLTNNEEQPTNYDYFIGKKTSRTYVSKRIKTKYPDDTTRDIRIVSKVIDSEGGLTHIKLKDEIVLRTTPNGRQQIVAKIFEDTKGIFCLVIQKFTTETGAPHEISFSFIGNEIKNLKQFIDSIKFIDFSESEKERIEDESLRMVREVISSQPDLNLLIELAQSKITKADVVSIAYRKEQLGVFRNLLFDCEYFKKVKLELSKNRDEDVWQYYFEKNPWIFGYGLNYIFNSPLEGSKLERITKGADVAGAGKRTDALLKTLGLVNSLCLVELKLHSALLLKEVKNSYRSDCWQVSDELSGGIAQIQKTVAKTVKNIGDKLRITHDGNPTGEEVYLFQPKSYLIIGSLDEFNTPNGVNEEKYSSFELYRKSLANPEIITFDELYERAKFIVHNNEEDAS